MVRCYYRSDGVDVAYSLILLAAPPVVVVDDTEGVGRLVRQQVGADGVGCLPLCVHGGGLGMVQG